LRILPVLILAVAAVLRGIYLLLYAGGIPLYSVPLVDAMIYDAWAGRIAAGDWQGAAEGVFYRAPLYPYLLAGIRLLFGQSIPWAYLVQMLMGLGVLFLACRLACRLVGRVGGLAALALLALYGPLMASESKLLTTTPGIFLHLLVLWSAIRFSESGLRRHALSAGICLGLSALVRPQWLILAALLPVLAEGGSRRMLRWWPFAIGVILMIAPVTLRNRIVGDDWVLISSNGGITFFQGNNEENRSGLLTISTRFELLGSAVNQQEMERRVAERETGRRMKPSEISSFWARQGVDFILSSPGEWLVLQGRKLYRIVTSYEYADNYSYYLEAERLWPLRVAFIPFGAVLALGVLGAFWCRPGRFPDRVVLASAAIALLSCLVFFVNSRYRMEAVPALAVLGGVALARLVEAGGIRGRRRWIGPAVSGLLFSASFLPAGLPARSQESISYLQVGSAMEIQGRLRDAERAYRQAIELLPVNLFAWNRLAMLTERLEGADEAISLLSGAPAEPVQNHPLTEQQMGILHLKLGMDEEAAYWLDRAVQGNPHMREGHELLASIYGRLGRYREVEASLREAVSLGPDRADLWSRLGYARIQLREYETARQAYRMLLSLRPGDAGALLNLAICAFHLGELREASERLEELGDGVSDDPLVLYYRGLLAWRESGREPVAARDAVSDLDRVLRMEPGSFRALYYGTLARFRAGDTDGISPAWIASWGPEIREILPKLMGWLQARSGRAWGEPLSDAEDHELRRLEGYPLGDVVIARIRRAIAEE